MYQATYQDDRAKKRLKITILAIHSPFILPSFLRREEKRGNINQSRDFKSCLSARSIRKITLYIFMLMDFFNHECSIHLILILVPNYS